MISRLRCTNLCCALLCDSRAPHLAFKDILWACIRASIKFSTIPLPHTLIDANGLSLPVYHYQEALGIILERKTSLYSCSLRPLPLGLSECLHILIPPWAQPGYFLTLRTALQAASNSYKHFTSTETLAFGSCLRFWCASKLEA